MREPIIRQAAATPEPAAAQSLETPELNPLSEREMDVARLLVTGAGNAEIARELVISPHTVKVHLRNIFEKLAVNSRTEASLVLLQRGWIVVPGVEPPAPAVEEPAPIPALPPLGDLVAAPRPWQLGIVAMTLLLCLLGLMLPVRGAQPKSPAALLSDSEHLVLGQPAIENLSRWTALAALPEPRSRHAAVQIGPVIYVVGGENMDGATIRDVAAYDVGSDAWRFLAELPEPRANLGLAHAGAFLYSAGGSVLDWSHSPATQVVDELMRYDLAADAWESVGVLPGPRAGAGFLALDDGLLLIGGWDGAAIAREVWRLPLPALDALPVVATDWEQVALLPQGLAFMGVVVQETDVIVAGGYDGRDSRAEVRALEIASWTWRDMPSLMTPRSGLHLVYDGLSLLAVGGGWTHAMASHERLDTLSGQWQPLPSPIRREWRHFAATTDSGNIYLIGGWSGDYLATNLRFQSTFRALLPAIPNLGDN